MHGSHPRPEVPFHHKHQRIHIIRSDQTALLVHEVVLVLPLYVVEEEARVARRKEAHEGHVLEEGDVGGAAECLVHREHAACAQRENGGGREV